jgi:hypothetical protein
LWSNSFMRWQSIWCDFLAASSKLERARTYARGAPEFLSV